MNIIVVILVAALLTGIAIIVSEYLRDIKAARAQLDSLGIQVIKTACGSIEYARIGSGYPVLVVQALWTALTRACGWQRVSNSQDTRSLPSRASVTYRHMVIIDQAGHNVCEEQPGKVQCALRDFLAAANSQYKMAP